MYRIFVLSAALLLISVMLITSCTQQGSLPIGTEQPSQTTITTITSVVTTTVAQTTNTTSTVTPTPPSTPSTTQGSQLPAQSPRNAILATIKAQYVVFEWNDLGMHCANPSYDAAVLLPPYNTIWAQVVKRGNPPQVITTRLTVEYRIVNNTYSYGKGSYAQFWDNMQKIFGVTLAKNTGLNLSDPNVHNGLSGIMAAKSDHFEAVGIPVTPYEDNGVWNPYQVAEVTVKDAAGNVLARTQATVPISDEINCAKCHGANAFQDILQKHDRLNGTNLLSQQPVLCASCHGDPALGKPDAGQFKYVSQIIHTFHAAVNPQPSCYDCHPGDKTKCSRSLAHTSANGNCTTCHGTLSTVGNSISTGRVPWANEPKCVTCHPGVVQVDTGNILYRNATGHGGMYCAGCHGSPHAMIPTSQASDNYQAIQYQGAAKSIGDCGSCHGSSRGGGNDPREYAEKHGGLNTRLPNACNVCHTAVSPNTTQWPHQFQWKS